LAKALTTARTALGEFNVEGAQQELAKAEKLPMLPDHALKYDRLRQLAHNVGEFRGALGESAKTLQGGQTIVVATTMVGIVETFPGQDRIILRVAGANRTYRFSDLPVGLAVALADQWLAKDQASSHLIRASYVVAHRNVNDEMKDKARQWLDIAGRELPEPAKAILAAMNDTYDLEKDLDKLTELQKSATPSPKPDSPPSET